MGAAKKLNYKKVLRDLVPINALSESHIGEVTKKADIEDVRSGRYVFRKGDRDYQSVYLLEGTVELIEDGRNVVSTVKAGSEEALHPLDHKQPRQLSARASGKVTVARIDSRLLDVLLTWDESAGYDVVEIDAHDDDDWMTRMLQSQAFLQLPPSNIHQLLMRLESVNVHAGDVVIRQDEEGDYFYIVKNGCLEVTRKTSNNGKEVVLAELGEGACFGEEALVSEAKRNASVTMITDGLLMRLSKDDFNELLRAPLVRDADFAAAEELVSSGAQWLDVRLPGEFENRAIKGSANVPLSALRDQSVNLDSNRTYILCCDTGRRSSAGAFVLSQRGFNVYTLKNGLMDVPDDALINAPAEDAVKHQVKDAEIIPFDSDSKSPAEAVEGKTDEAAQPSPADTAQIDKLRCRLQASERQFDEQSRAAEQEKARLQTDLDAIRQALEASQQRLNDTEDEKKSLQEELSGMQQRLAQVQASAEGHDNELRNELEQMAKRLDQQQQAHDQQSGALQQELDQLRAEYSQLEERSNAVAGERDAAFEDLEQTRRDLSSSQEQLAVQQGEASAQQASLTSQLEQQIESATERAEASQSRTRELESQLTANEQKMQELEQLLQAAGEREQSLQGRLEQVEQKSLDELQRSQTEASTQLAEVNERNAALQLQLDDQSSQLQQQQSEREELERRLKDTQQSLEQATERRRQIEEQLAQGEGASSEVQKALDQSIADADQLREQLDRAKQQYAESEKQASQLNARLNSVEKEHASDIASLREAVTRAQDERENVSREQTRLMKALRKAERDLERTRQDNETEVYRLQKELKEATGESSAGLAALQEQLQQAAQQRDELEVQLGERSTQMESALSEAEKLGQQLELAQDSARQAEQQLIEANQAENEEMTARLDVERQAQQALREQLETVTSERNQTQERLTVQNHELEELRNAVQQAQAEATANKHGAQAVQEAAQQMQELQALREAVRQLEQARDEALNLQQQTQQEVDQLRAEAEVNRGLVNMQASMSDSDEALHAELVEGKKNVEVAVRLRIQAEEKVTELQQQVERLQLELSQSRATENMDEQTGRISALDASDPQVSALLSSGSNDQQDDASSAEADAGPPAEVPVYAVELGEAEAEKTGGSKMLVIMLFAAVLAAAGAYWWFGQKFSVESSANREAVSSGTVEVPAVEELPTAVDKHDKTEAEAQREVPRESTDQPKTLPSFIKGMSQSPTPANARKSTGAEAAEPPTPAQAEQKAVEISTEKVEEQALAAQVQALRSFSDTLESGGSAPTLVEFRADSFEMGSSSASANFAERPRHRVKLKRFAIGKYEVTFDEYDRFAQATGRLQPSSAGWGRGKRPVIHVSWKDAVAYTRWLSEQTGSHYRLPTEAEWEYAARSGSDKLFWWGNDVGEANANCFDCASEWSGSKTAPVGSFAASALAVHDMAGNVMEWVQDCYRPGYAEAPHDGSAVEFAGCEQRVVRGGGFGSPANMLRSASRVQRSPESRLDDLGFRVVREFQ